MNIIPYGKQNITQEDIDAVVKALTSDFLTQGPRIAEFEKEFASYIGCKYAVALANGTGALHLAAIALNVSTKSRVLTTPITFAASANCVLYCGGTVEFVDIDPETYLIDLTRVEKLLATKPAGYYEGIIPVDFAGYPVDLERLKAIADKYKLWIIEDACHAPGAYFTDSTGKKQNCGNGNFADLAVFSFHPVKHIATGEGGMITTNNEELYRKIVALRTHGITRDQNLLIENHGGWYYEMQELGFNYRLTDVQAALGSSQLKKAPAGLSRRDQIAKRYVDALQGLPLKFQKKSTDSYYNAHHLFVVETERRKELYDYLKTKNIYSQVHYIPVHLMPYYKQLGWSKNSMPVAENYYEHCLSLPMYPSLTDDEQSYVIDSIISFFK